MPKFGRRSRGHLSTCHPDLVRLAEAVVRYVDCSCIEGIRSDADQAKFFAMGLSKLDGVTRRSKHQKQADGKSHAMHLVPYPIDWKDRERFIHFTGIVRGMALLLGIPIRLGADWDGDGIFDESFFDAAHIELRG